MLFNSTEFLLVFFPLVTLLYFALPHRFRWALLLAASCYFYMAFIPVYIAILGFTIVVDYFAAFLIEGAQGRRRLWMLTLSLIANIGVLFVFKYFNFVNANLAALAAFLHWHYPLRALQLILPIGLSFHTFQAMSYTIEVYRGHQKPERHFGIYALYVMFYPQLVAGPIERPQNLLPQFHTEHRFDAARAASGMRLMLWGLFKKVIIADRLSVVADQVYNHPHQFGGLAVLLATYAFAYQIYCDFSGYSDIAIGAARVMGIDLMRNFDRPYSARSVAEFWKRWHISLSTWFRDYLYIPLGGNRVSEPRRYFNLFVVFAVSGFWHGANWTFIVWGVLHGLYLIAAIVLAPLLERGSRALAWPRWAEDAAARLFTFHLVVLAWIFFRANSVGTAVLLLRRLAEPSGLAWSWTGIRAALPYLGLRPLDALICVLGVVLLEAVDSVRTSAAVSARFERLPDWQRWSVYYAAAAGIAAFGVFQSQAFIYFQF